MIKTLKLGKEENHLNIIKGIYIYIYIALNILNGEILKDFHFKTRHKTDNPCFFHFYPKVLYTQARVIRQEKKNRNIQIGKENKNISVRR